MRDLTPSRPSLTIRTMDGDAQLLTHQAPGAGLWLRGYRAFADSRITALIVLLLTLGLLLPMATTGYFIFRSYRHALQQQFDDDLQRTAAVLARSSSSLLWNLQHDIAAAMLQSHMTDERICAVAIQDELSGRVFIELKNVRCTGRRHATATPILNASTQIGTVRLVMGDGTLQARIADRVWELAAVLGLQLLMLLSVVVPAVLFKIIRPLRRLHRQTGKLSDGELGLAFEWRRHDEIGQVGRAMDAARRQLKDLLEEQTRAAARQALNDQQREENLRLAAAVEQDPLAARGHGAGPAEQPGEVGLSVHRQPRAEGAIARYSGLCPIADPPGGACRTVPTCGHPGERPAVAALDQ